MFEENSKMTVLVHILLRMPDYHYKLFQKKDLYRDPISLNNATELEVAVVWDIFFFANCFNSQKSKIFEKASKSFEKNTAR